MMLSRCRALAARGALAIVLALGAAAAPLAGCARTDEHEAAAPAEATLTDAQAQAILKTLVEAPSQGFALDAFPTAGLRDELASRDDEVRSRAQRRLVAEVLAYARAEHGFAIPRKAMDPNWGMRSAAQYDAAAELRNALAQNRLSEWLAGLPPPFPRYEALRRGYLVYLKIAQSGGWPQVPPGPPLKAGARGPRVAALRQRLAFEDATLDPDAPIYDQALAAAVARFQARHGLTTNGVVDAPTLAALNVPALARAAQLRANLERWRWAPRDLPATRIEVNSAGATFDLYQDDQPVLHMLVAAGRPGDETPIVASKIHTIVLNPSWNVPPEIAARELLPKGASYLAAHHFVHEGERLVQKPGEGNALGQVKFLFDNPYSVYLHDTPAKAAFTRPQRSVSHGCVRLERAVDLAKLLLGDNPDWPPERIDDVLAGDRTVSIPLKPNLPVELFYWTAFVEGDQVSFRDDVYGWDEAVLRRLDAATAGHA